MTWVMKYGLPSFKFKCGGVYNKLWLVILILICTAQQVLPAYSCICLRIAGKLPELSTGFLCPIMNQAHGKLVLHVNVLHTG